MIAVLNEMTGLEKFFLVCAILGGICLVIRLILQFVGGDSDIDGDADIDIDTDADAGGGDSDVSFKLLSFQGLTAFFMMFGLVGLALLRQSGWDPTRAIIVAFAAGVATMWVIKQLFVYAAKMQSSGTMHIEKAIGREGTVYLTIPTTGTGKARITLQNHLKVFDAISEGEQEIKTGERVRVVRVVSRNILVVEKIS